ncbi:MAG: scavenger receptor cysteine-rich domain-containing protein [Promethearchaeia archaeon]
MILDAETCVHAEIKHNGQWGTVCDDAFRAPAAQVVCRQIGCTGGEVKYQFGGLSKEKAASMPIWLDGVSCSGTEKGLSFCAANGWGKHKCMHSDDVGVCCAGGCGVPDDSEGQESGAGADGEAITEEDTEGMTPEEVDELRTPTMPIRMRDCQGMCCRVEVKYEDSWGSVCDDGFKRRSAQVVCRQLKCGGGEVVMGFGGPNPPGPIWMDQVNCAGEEKVRIFACIFRARAYGLLAALSHSLCSCPRTLHVFDDLDAGAVQVRVSWLGQARLLTPARRGRLLQ